MSSERLERRVKTAALEACKVKVSATLAPPSAFPVFLAAILGLLKRKSKQSESKQWNDYIVQVQVIKDEKIRYPFGCTIKLNNFSVRYLGYKLPIRPVCVHFEEIQSW
jgi:hypothetical protein